jgi:hypothetical protein
MVVKIRVRDAVLDRWGTRFRGEKGFVLREKSMGDEALPVMGADAPW